MITDFEVEIRPGNTANNLVVSLTASDPDLNLNRKEFLRTSFPIDASIIKDLRSGNPQFDLVMKIANEMSTWLMGSDAMSGHLHSHILGGGPVRLIFRMHQGLPVEMADLPIELLRYENDWVILRKAISAIVHELPDTGLPTQPNPSLPLKVLVVRSSPSGLKVKVPPAGPICNHIIKLGEELGPNVVHVDLLSREVTSLGQGKTWDEFEAEQLPDLMIKADDPPEVIDRKEELKWREFREYLLNRKIEALEPGTWDKFATHMRKNSTNYHILVYLGHGNYLNLYGSKREEDKVGVLQFEKSDGKSADPIASSQLQQELQNRKVPVPVVMLIGCLTAAEVEALDPEIKEVVNKNTPDWTFGSRGVAQKLVNSASGVQCAVGMRYQIDTNAAFTFLKTFFKSLLKETPGNVEAAVRAGRWGVSNPPFPPSWSAPVIFRTRGIEPMFKFIEGIPRTYKLDRDDTRNQQVREALWTALTEDPNYQFAYDKLAETENVIKKKVMDAGGALIMPEMIKTTPGQTIEVKISLSGQLSADRLICALSVSGPGTATIRSLHSTKPLRDAGFMLADMTEAMGSEIGFTIRRNAGVNALPEGVIVVVELSFDALNRGLYTLNLHISKTEPDDISVRPINNVVLIVEA